MILPHFSSNWRQIATLAATCCQRPSHNVGLHLRGRSTQPDIPSGQVLLNRLMTIISLITTDNITIRRRGHLLLLANGRLWRETAVYLATNPEAGAWPGLLPGGEQVAVSMKGEG